tara:strand:+ start:1798 stop:1998 length:201 start_codon:yes stop_codon:yes gene_type:complete
MIGEMVDTHINYLNVRMNNEILRDTTRGDKNELKRYRPCYEISYNDYVYNDSRNHNIDTNRLEGSI